MRPVDSTLRDRYELDFLSGLQDQRAALAIARKQTEGALNMGIPGQPSQPGETSVKVRDDDLAIVNRSPTTHIYNHHGVPIWAILLFILVIALLLGGAWLLLHPSLPTAVPVSPSTPTVGEDFSIQFFDP